MKFDVAVYFELVYMYMLIMVKFDSKCIFVINVACVMIYKMYLKLDTLFIKSSYYTVHQNETLNILNIRVLL